MSETTDPDRAIARQILNGDENAFRRLFDGFFPRLYRFALVRLEGDREAASDVVQQTFCRAIEKLDTYRGEAALYTWFCQVCRHTLVDYWRTTQRETRLLVPFEDEPDLRALLESFAAPAGEQPEVQAWRRDVRRLVQATVDTLPDRYGEILEWKYIDGLSVNEIAQHLQVGVKAAESLLSRARTAFREHMLMIAGAQDAFRPPHAGTEV